MALPKKSKTQPPATVQNFPIVGIGASAGGLDAFKRLLTAIPESSGMAYVLVQHLDPNHESILPEILQRVTKIPVHEISDDIHLAPNHIYIIPSNKILTSTNGVLQLTTRDKKILNLSIDIFFKSLADVHKEFAVGVVLSGAGSDGTLGLKAIKEHGGISIAQDLESAAYDSMPKSAVKAGVVDFVLSPEEIPAHLLQISSSYESSHFFKGGVKLPKDDEYVFKQILELLRQRSGVDFTYYKQPTFHRRIARRMAIVRKNNLADYLKYLRAYKAEQDALFQDVLIPVTSFFRDPTTFQALIETVFPSIQKNKSSDEAIRIWIAGCSTGEEAYSVAICLYEYLTLTLSKAEGTNIQIFASDISEKAVKIARLGIYTKADVEVFSAIQVKNYFEMSNGSYQVRKIIRDMCVFAPHNFLKDPPFARIDLISCRNVLIYMDTFLQKKAFTTFHYALKEGGFLVLGKSETIGASSDLFTQVSKHEKIYSRKSLPGRFIHVGIERKEGPLSTNDLLAGQVGKPATKYESVQADFRKSAEEVMILKSPASVVVNGQMDIVHIHGDITPFLQAPQGKPTHNLIKMARDGLAFELRNAIHKATKDQAGVIKENVPVKSNGKHYLVTIEIISLTNTIEPHFLVRFEKEKEPVVTEEKKSSSRRVIESQNVSKQLEDELAQVRDDMRSISEDMEAANEELQSANEELQSSNEEMQSLNEELETSKEELQSTNEELIIVNQELLDKQLQVRALHSVQVEAHKLVEASEKRFSNILSQSIMAIGILKGTDMVIASANDALLATWGKGADVLGKSLFEVIPELKGQGFIELLRQVYSTGVPYYGHERKVNLVRNGKDDEAYYNFVYQPYTEGNNRITGVTMLAIEVSDQVRANGLIEQSERKFRELSGSLEIKVEERTAELKLLLENLRQSNLQLDQFAHLASHDLQEPVRKVLTFSRRIQDNHKDGLSNEVRSYLENIEGAAVRMQTLIRDLLDYSSLKYFDELFVLIDLNELLKKTLDDFEVLRLERKAEIKSDKLPSIEAIPLQVAQLFNNLIGNALKYSKTDVIPQITITSQELTEEEKMRTYTDLNPSMSYIKLVFKDNGIGFEQKYADKIFIIFQRLHGREAYPGTGIGLAVCRRIVDNHNGQIFATGKLDIGSEFHVILPIKQSV